MSSNRTNRVSSARTANPSGRRDKTREEIPIYVTAARVQSLNNIKIDTILQKILSDSGCVIQITLSPDNQAVTNIVDEESRKRIGGLADISRLAGFRKFATDERKKSSVSEVLYPIEEKAFRVYEQIILDAPGTPAKKLGAVSIAALKDSNSAVEILLANRKIIEPKLTDSSESVKATAKTMIAWIEHGLVTNTQLVSKIIKGEDFKGFIYDNLFSLSVPKWGYDKLSRTKLAEIEGFDFRRVLFPADAKKGLAFTVRELRSANMRARNSFVLSYSGFQKQLVSDHSMLQLICATSEPVEIDNEASVYGTQLRNEKVLITAPYYDLEFLFGGKARGKYSSFSVKPDYSSPRNSLRSIVEAVLCVQSFEMQLSDQKTEVWEKIALGLSVNFKDNISAKRNLFAVAIESKTILAPRIESIYKLESHMSRALFYEWVRIVGRFTTDSALLAKIKIMLGITDESLTPENRIVADVDSDSETYAMSMICPNRPVFAPVTGMMKKIETASDQLAFKSFRNAIGTAELGGPKKKKSKGTSVTELGPESKLAIAKISKNDRCRFLKEPIEEWLRGFVSKKLQAAAAGIVLAQFDSLLDEDLDSDEDDSSDDEVDTNAAD